MTAFVETTVYDRFCFVRHESFRCFDGGLLVPILSRCNLPDYTSRKRIFIDIRHLRQPSIIYALSYSVQLTSGLRQLLVLAVLLNDYIDFPVCSCRAGSRARLSLECLGETPASTSEWYLLESRVLVEARNGLQWLWGHLCRWTQRCCRACHGWREKPRGERVFVAKLGPRSRHDQFIVVCGRQIEGPVLLDLRR